MNIYKITSLIALATIFTSSLVGAAELRYPQLERPQSSFEVKKKVAPRKLEIKKIYKHNCKSEGYVCADGYRCQLLMTAAGEDAKGNQVRSRSGATTLKFYKCEISGRTRRPTCSKGMTPTGRFTDGLNRDLRSYSGGVREYSCEIIQ